MLAILFEYLGSLIFYFVIAYIGQPIAVAAAFLGAVFFSYLVSGAHLNPAVSAMMYLMHKIDGVKLVQYIAAQLLAAVSSIYLVSAMPQMAS